MYHPSRGGVRGGSDQFDWEDVKADKHRESYLGHSVKAPVGRWQKGKDLHWYTKSGKANTQLSKQQERDAVKKLEAEALAIALGKQSAVKGPTGLTKQELAEVCRKGQVERDSMDIERVEGMGFGSSRARLMDTSAEPVKETLGAYGSTQMGRHDGRPGFEDEEKQQIPLRNTATAVEGKSEHKKKKKEKKKSKKERKHKKRQQSGYSSTEEKKRAKRKHAHSDRDPTSGYKETKRKRRYENDSDSSAAEGEKHSRIHCTSTNETRSSKHKDRRRTHPDNRESEPKVRRQRHDTE